eukprot:14650102-Alexandrium_andersonii.AAC.1
MPPAVAPAWHHYATLAVVVARFVLAGRADARGRMKGTPLSRSASERGRTLGIHLQARLRALE